MWLVALSTMATVPPPMTAPTTTAATNWVARLRANRPNAGPNRRVRTVAPAGTNTILVTHFPNISRAFPQSSAGLEDGEALIFAPNGKGGAVVVARIKIEEWSHLGA